MNLVHEQLVSGIANQVGNFYSKGEPFYIYHGNTNSTRILHFKRGQTIDISRLNRVLSIDKTNQTAKVEPNVPMDRLVRATLKRGFVPKVVMEFPGITVGGGIQGGAGESSSFKYGCFNQICNNFEMVLADGKIIIASSSENSDLFYGTAGSFGTLGIITAADVQLIPAKKYVQLTYIHVTSFEDAIGKLNDVAKQNFDYIDGIMFSKNNGTIIVGNLSDEVAGEVHRFTRAHDQWYYIHAKDICLQSKEITETIPLVDYLFRYDRGAFWVGSYAFEVIKMSSNKFTRWLFNHFLHTRKLYQALQEGGVSQQYIVQDLAMPLDVAATFMRFVDKNLHVYPLWLCPLKTDDKSPFQPNNIKTPLVINVGVWSNRIKNRKDFLSANRMIEQKVSSLGGKKWFYAHSYYTKSEFWKIYDRKWYEGLRKKYNASTLPDVFDKLIVKKLYDVNLKKGATRTMLGIGKLRITE